MVDLKADLDTLVEEAMAFAKSIRVESPMPRIVVEPNRVPSANSINSERADIMLHVANFKAHQQRLKREREDYAASEFKRMLASCR
jgi:N-formylglutamate amidohydrolase